ncbi:MAG: S8 family peptidase [Bacteroidetes bacterium]|nr:S8 family peptidase [Bacteroidota bacterium]
MKKITIFLTVFFLFHISFSLAQSKITDRLYNEITLTEKNKPIDAIIVLKDQYPIWALDKQLYENKVSLQERAFTVITELQKHAKNIQKNIVDFLSTKSKENVLSYKSFWITNVISIEATKEIMIELADHSDISNIDLDEFSAIIDPIETKPALKYLGRAEENLKVVNAHKMWAEGFTGEGVIVANLDTGVDGNHSALSTNWHGNTVPWQQAWYDAFEGTTFPSDPEGSQLQAGHGTGTMGVIAGLDPLMQDTIGMAFGAEWIAARAKFVAGNTSISQILECMEWIVDPDGNPTTSDDMPIVLNNSWGGGSDCTTPYDNAIQAIEAAGIAVVWAAGNSGPAPGSITAPSNQNHTEVTNFSVGGVTNYDPELPIDPWSSRGPTPCNSGTGNTIKPEISAPIVARSCHFNDEYYIGKGTSIAAPHAAGAIALLKQAFPDKTGTALKYMLYGSARDMGIPGEDNDYGMGLLDVWAAYNYQPSPLDPRRPVGVNAMSDYTTQTSVSLSWSDPYQLLNGDPLTAFDIQIFRNEEWIADVPVGTESFLDEELIDGQKYEYRLWTHDLISDSLGVPEDCFAWAGGSPFPAPPNDLTCTFTGINVKLEWTDPVTQSDGSFLDDLDQILVYRNDILIDSVEAGVEVYFDDPIPNCTSHYTLVSADNESPVHYSEKSVMVPCFAGDCPAYLVWVGPDALLESKYSGDSLYNTLRDLYLPVYKTNDIFEFGTDLNQHEVIFVALGNFPFMHILSATGNVAPALENFLFNGGKLYFEGGFAFDPIPLLPWFPVGYDIHAWFGLEDGNEGSGDVLGVTGQNNLSEFTFDYIGINNYMNELNPATSTVIWKNSQNEDICGVFFDGYGTGKSIGVTTPFGSLQSDSFTKKQLMESYLGLFNIVISETPESPLSPKKIKEFLNIYPNPIFNNVSIEFPLLETGLVSFDIYDLMGQHICNLISEKIISGDHRIVWNANELPPGIYFCTLKTNGGIQTKKIIKL